MCHVMKFKVRASVAEDYVYDIHDDIEIKPSCVPKRHEVFANRMVIGFILQPDSKNLNEMCQEVAEGYGIEFISQEDDLITFEIFY
jgi:hypothetical protein